MARKKDKRAFMQEFILNGGLPLKSKIVINNNHNVSVNANINNNGPSKGYSYDEDGKMANKVLGALALGSGGNQIF